jgi:hypothetical protein
MRPHVLHTVHRVACEKCRVSTILPTARPPFHDGSTSTDLYRCCCCGCGCGCCCCCCCCSLFSPLRPQIKIKVEGADVSGEALTCPSCAQAISIPDVHALTWRCGDDATWMKFEQRADDALLESLVRDGGARRCPGNNCNYVRGRSLASLSLSLSLSAHRPSAVTALTANLTPGYASPPRHRRPSYGSRTTPSASSARHARARFASRAARWAAASGRRIAA